MTKDEQGSMIPAIELSRLRDRSLGQADEVNALIEILKGAGQLMELVNDSLWSLINKKQDKSLEYKRQVINNASIILFDGLEKFVDLKSSRISKLINYLQMLMQDVEDEKKELTNFQSEWNPIQREISIIRIDITSLKPTSKEDGIKQMNRVKNDILKKALPTLDKLINLETKMQKRHISAIALLTKMNSSVDTNELYKLLTREL